MRECKCASAARLYMLIRKFAQVRIVMAQQMRYICDIYSDAQYLRKFAHMVMREFAHAQIFTAPLLRHYCAITAPLLRHYGAITAPLLRHYISPTQ